MASLCNDNGRHRIVFDAPNGKRPCIRLSADAPLELAEKYRDNIGKLVACHGHPETLPEEVLRWAVKLSPKVYSKLAKAGLLPPREPITAPEEVTLGGFLTRYVESRNADAKPNTIRNLTATKNALVGFFGEDKPLIDINPGDADEWRRHMLKHGWGDNTVRRRTGIARQFFRSAIRHELLTRNPFDGFKTTVKADMTRFRFISREEAVKVLAACPSTEWKLIFALSRYGGLRCPSEHMALKWADIDSEH